VDPSQLLQLMNQVLALKAGGAAEPASASAGNLDSLTSALEKMTSTFEQRLEKFGKKLGVSGAVEVDPAQLDGLLKHMDDVKLESNMSDVDVKKKSGAGIAGNLARLKKLKGGG
jgi:hypothetical protein